MSQTEKRYIYILSDPRTQAVRYVGQTKNPKNRQTAHNGSCDASSPKYPWTQELFKAGLKPLFQVIEEMAPALANEREKYWIAHYRELGADLLNVTEGGEFNLDTKSGRPKKAVHAQKFSISLPPDIAPLVELAIRDGGLSVFVGRALKQRYGSTPSPPPVHPDRNEEEGIG